MALHKYPLQSRALLGLGGELLLVVDDSINIGDDDGKVGFGNIWRGIKR